MSSITIGKISTELDKIIPLSWQESYDNAGLLCGNKDVICTGIYVCFDISESVVDKAIESNCNLIVSHHPLVFRAMKRFTGKDNVTTTLLKAITNNIALYSAHTNLDAANPGVNTILANKLGIRNIRPLCEDARTNEDGFFGIGGIGELEEATDLQEYLLHIKKALNIHNIKYIEGKNDKIKTVAFCGGSGSEFIDDALRQNADCFLTADIKYHQFLDCEKQIALADIGHFESESFIKEHLIALLSEKFCNFVPLFMDTAPNKVKNI